MYDEELEKKKTKGDSVWTEGSGVPVPQEPDMGSSRPKKPVKKASGGSISSASKRADGIAQRGKITLTSRSMPKAVRCGVSHGPKVLALPKPFLPRRRLKPRPGLRRLVGLIPT